jgi:hypothetical protein
VTTDTLSTDPTILDGARCALLRSDSGSWLDVLAEAVGFGRAIMNREV